MSDELHHIAPTTDGTVRVDVTPASAGWRYLSFAVVELAAGQTHTSLLTDRRRPSCR